MNTITQLVLRAKCRDDWPERVAAAILNQNSYHINRWLQYMIDEGSLDRAVALTPHAERVAIHVKRAQIVSMWCAFLFGNLALAYRALGLFARARDVLE